MTLERLDRALAKVLRALAHGGGAVLFGLMALIAFDIVMRALRIPFLGGYEITQQAMTVLVWLGIPYCAITRGHVAVDVLGRWLDRPKLRWVVAAIHALGAALLATVAGCAVDYALDSLRNGEATNMMAIPKYPFQLLTGIGAGFYALVLVVQSVQAARGEGLEGRPTP